MRALMERVLEANLELWRRGLVIFTWGNVSEVDRERGVVAIKPSGVPYASLSVSDIVVLELETGRQVEGRLNPSSDTPTHLALYRAFAEIGGVTHTHSRHATAWAQAGLPIPCYGTTHADYFFGEIPCARGLTEAEINTHYETHTGDVIVETFRSRNPSDCPAVLVKNHGPFTWGKSGMESVENAVVLEEVAALAMETRAVFAGAEAAPKYLCKKHYYRKHGTNAYYGQKK